MIQNEKSLRELELDREGLMIAQGKKRYEQQLKKNSIVPGGLFEISKSDEKKLDAYEDYPALYKKYYFHHYGNKVMTYTMVNKTPFKFPTERYLNVVKRGYQDCNLNKKFLIKALRS
jgi:gamma-glutamylcyclotransferase (GGCT)/AIG2-like uncharacterized protein YtfP